MTIEVVLRSIFTAAFIATIIRISTPLILPALGGLISELAGVLNIALEGIMLAAAFAGVIAGTFAPQWFPSLPLWTAPWFGVLAGVLVGMALAWIIAFFHLELGADSILTALAINILAQGGTVFTMFAITGDKGSTSTLASPAIPNIVIPFVNGVPVLGRLLNAENLTGYNAMTYAALVLTVLVWVFLYRTPLGVHLRAVGENPEAAASVGRRGFIALAVIYLGNRRPLGVLLAALLFGAASSLGAQLGTLRIPSQLIEMIPAVMTIAALVIYNLRRRAALRATMRKFQEKAT
jgi:simple sugar transport system permease protein